MIIRRGIRRLRRSVLRPRWQPERKGLILMYHRVVNLRSDPWSLAVTPQRFAQHLEILQQHTHPTSLRQLFEGLLSETLEDRSVAVTFDDGYADNLYSAKPLLERYDIPATFFLTAGYVGCGREFWWDELERIFLQPGTLPDVLRLSFNGRTYQWELGKGAHYSSEESTRRRRGWRAWGGGSTSRRRLYYSLWELLYSLREEGERQRLLDQLRAWAGAEPALRPTHRPLSSDEVVRLAQGELIEVGAHTVTHPALAALPTVSQREEILQSKAQLEAILDRPVTSFAYPHGSLSEDTVDLVRKSGFSRACTTVPGVVEPSTDPLRSPRVPVQDWEGREFAGWLSSWFDT